MQRNSQEYKDANELWELFSQTKARIFDTCDEVVNENKAKIILKVGKFVSKQVTLSLSELPYALSRFIYFRRED